jgi:hypothetical protein
MVHTYILTNFVSPEAQLPCIDTVADTGKYIGEILVEPDKYEGKVFSASTDVYSYEETVEAMSKASGKTVKYAQLPLNTWRGFLPPDRADNLVGMFQYIEEFGYYGPDTKGKVEWTAKQTRGELTTLEEYFEKFPLQLL